MNAPTNLWIWFVRHAEVCGSILIIRVELCSYILLVAVLVIHLKIHGSSRLHSHPKNGVPLPWSQQQRLCWWWLTLQRGNRAWPVGCRDDRTAPGQMHRDLMMMMMTPGRSRCFLRQMGLRWWRMTGWLGRQGVTQSGWVAPSSGRLEVTSGWFPVRRTDPRGQRARLSTQHRDRTWRWSQGKAAWSGSSLPSPSETCCRREDCGKSGWRGGEAASSSDGWSAWSDDPSRTPSCDGAFRACACESASDWRPWRWSYSHCVCSGNGWEYWSNDNRQTCRPVWKNKNKNTSYFSCQSFSYSQTYL